MAFLKGQTPSQLEVDKHSVLPYNSASDQITRAHMTLKRNVSCVSIQITTGLRR
jgi:hypothetical protein